jgi:hypothetical protein
MNLNDILQASQGGQGVNNLASQFGLAPEQAQAAVQAMLPAFSQALQNVMANPGSFSGVLTQMASGAHQGSFTDPSQIGAAGGLGGGALGQIFGSPEIIAQLTQHISQMSGVSPQVIQSMMPAVASMILGGLAHTMTTQGMGAILGQIANAATAAGGTTAGGTPAAGGMFGGILSSIFGSLLGGAQQASAAQSSAVQSGLGTLSGMLEAGVQISQAHQQGLNSILQSLANQAKG